MTRSEELDQFSANQVRANAKRLAEAMLLGILEGIRGAMRSAGTSPATVRFDPKTVDSGNPLLKEPNICRGLNTCKGKGAGSVGGGPNQCAGQSVCAIATNMGCATSNNCRGLGGCNAGDPTQVQVDYPGENTCRGKGACGVPIAGKDKRELWKKVRRRFEALMADAGRSVGPYPPWPFEE
jgi:hypothetical protein